MGGAIRAMGSHSCAGRRWTPCHAPRPRPTAAAGTAALLPRHRLSASSRRVPSPAKRAELPRRVAEVVPTLCRAAGRSGGGKAATATPLARSVPAREEGAERRRLAGGAVCFVELRRTCHADRAAGVAIGVSSFGFVSLLFLDSQLDFDGPISISWPSSSGNPAMCRALVRAHHKLRGTRGAANPRFIQREVFANRSVKASAE
jgi:hypothetical protein